MSASKVLTAKLIIEGEDRGTGKVFQQVAAEAKRAGDALKAAVNVGSTAKQVDDMAAAMVRASRASAAAGTAATREAATLKREVQGITTASASARSALDLSEPLRRDLAALQLTRKEIALLARDANRMQADREKAVAGIGNAKIREQVLAADRSSMEARIRERATGLAAQRQAEEAFARQIGTISRTAAAEKMRAAREAARVARDAEREATRVASEGARERARIARAEANAQMAAARQAARAAREGERANREYRRPIGGAVGAVGGSIGLAGAGYGAYRVVQKGARAGADSMREGSRDYLAGLTPADTDRIRARSMELSTRYPSVDANTLHERLRDTALAMGSVEKAFEVADTIGRSSVVLQSLKGKEASLEEGRRFFSALDALGKNQDPAQVRRLMDGWIRALGVEGADLDMGGLLKMTRAAKSGGASLNERFLMTVAPALMQDLGPDRLGTALGSEVAQIIGGRATKQAKAYQGWLGMRDGKGNFNTADRDLITSDPYEYTKTRLIPLLKAKGIDIDNNSAVTEAMSKAFSNQVVADLFVKMISQREQYDRKREQYGRAPGLDAADKLASKDPYVALAGAGAQLTNVLMTLAEPVMPKATEALNAFSAKAAEFAKFLGENPKVAETTAATAGTIGAQALLGPVMTMPLGVAGGGYLDWNFGGNPGAVGALMGQESDASKTARHVQDQAAGAAAARGAPVPRGWGQRRRKVLPDAPDAGKGVTGDYRFGGDVLHDFLWGQTKRTLTLPGFGTGRALAVPPETFDDLKAKAAEAGTQAGEKAGQGVADGIRTKGPAVETEAQTLFQRIRELFAQGINMPINFVPGQAGGFGGGGAGGPGAPGTGGGGSGGIVNASYRPDGGGAFGGVRRASGGGGAIPGRNAFGGVDPLAGGTAVEPDGVSRSGGSRSWRNNNPGNIEYGPFARSMGATGTDGRFARFPSYEAGRRAQASLLFESKGYRNLTLPQAIRRWAPGSENNVPAYVRAMGAYDPNKRMQDYTPAERAQLQDAMQRHEGWRPGKAGPRAVASTSGGDGDFFPNGAPRVLKPKSMPGAPGLTMEEADRRRRGPSADRTLPNPSDRTLPMPDAAPAGSGRGAGDLYGVADRMHAAAERFEKASMHARLEVVGLGDAGLRMKGMRATGSGALSADMGVSMPGAKEGGLA